MTKQTYKTTRNYAFTLHVEGVENLESLAALQAHIDAFAFPPGWDCTVTLRTHSAAEPVEVAEAEEEPKPAASKKKETKKKATKKKATKKKATAKKAEPEPEPEPQVEDMLDDGEDSGTRFETGSDLSAFIKDMMQKKGLKPSTLSKVFEEFEAKSIKDLKKTPEAYEEFAHRLETVHEQLQEEED